LATLDDRTEEVFGDAAPDLVPLEAALGFASTEEALTLAAWALALLPAVAGADAAMLEVPVSPLVVLAVPSTVDRF
jgi:hypothetical protein